MTLLSIFVVLSALFLVTALVGCGILYFSFVSSSRSETDEDTYILINSEDSVVSSICRDLLDESILVKPLLKRKLPSTVMCPDHMEATGENSMSTGKYNQLEIHKSDDAILPNTLNKIVDARNKKTAADNEPLRSNTNECVKLVPLLEEKPPNSSSIC